MFSEVVLKGSQHHRKFAMDIHWEETGTPKPVVLFLHGFKGFKDWGTFPIIAQTFAREGFVFAKVNMSHNGVTPKHPLDFVDLDAFSDNTFSIELQDIQDAIEFLTSEDCPVPASEVDSENLSLVGHSRGGSTAYLTASRDSRIRKVAGWGAVCQLENRWPDSMVMEWKDKGIYYLPNSRTGQLMPLKYGIVEDYLAHQEEYHIPSALSSLEIPTLHVHGSNDETVFLQEAKMVLKNIPAVQLEIIKDAGHTFGGSHPFEGNLLPDHTQQLLSITLDFLKT